MLLRLCQLKSLILLKLLLLGGCSYFQDSKEIAHELLSVSKNEWFKANPEHAILNQEGRIQTHQFFDASPDFGNSDTNVNAIILTPEGSEYAHELDLASGQRYYSHSYCSQKDIWNQYSGKVSTPTFTIGVIPRFLDQLGEAQKVFIYGGEGRFNKLTDSHEYRIRLVGALIKQSCPEGNCLGKSTWNSRMIFIAVDPEDLRFKDIYDIDALKNELNWKKEKAVIENLDGRNDGGKISYPSTRVGQLIKIDEAMEYYKKNSIFLSDKESTQIAQGCHLLYEKLWKDVGEERPEDRPAMTVEAVKAKLKLIEELKKNKKSVGFSARLSNFVQKHNDDFNSCQKFIYSGNVNLNPEKFWFLAYMKIFFKLHHDHYYFNCRTSSWEKNILDEFGKPIYDFKKGINDCKDKNIDQAMNYLPNFLRAIQGTESSSYRFLDYDHHFFGSHRKIYSWVKTSNKKFDCTNDSNNKIRRLLKNFPEDISWKPRAIRDMADKMKIIY
jgi:hypothetical protein